MILAKYAYLGAPNMVKWGVPEKILQNAVLADFPLVITMEDFKVVATADLWAYDAKYLCLSFFNQIASIRHLGGGNIKKVFS